MPKFLFVILLGIAPLKLLSQETAQKYDISGYYKTYLMFLSPSFVTNNLSGYSTYANLNNTLRVKFNLETSHNSNINLAYSVSPNIQKQTTQVFTTSLVKQAYRLSDLNSTLYSSDTNTPNTTQFNLYQNLDRANIQYSFNLADLILGRQAIAFGSAKIISPNNVLVPFNFQTLDKEELTGVDAIRVRIPIGNMEELDLAYVIGKNLKPDNSAVFANLKLYKLKTNFSILLINFQNNFMIGLDITRNIMDASIWVETAYTMVDFFNKYQASQNYLKLSIGLDYNLTENLYYFTEYHYNGAGNSTHDEFASLGSKMAYTEGASYLLSRHYLANNLTYQLSPLVSVSGLGIINLNDFSISLSLASSYSFSDNVVLDLGAVLGLGKRSEIINNELLVKSEFGLYPSYLYSSIRLYF